MHINFFCQHISKMCIVLLYRYVYYCAICRACIHCIHNNVNLSSHIQRAHYTRIPLYVLYAVFVVTGQHKPWLNRTQRIYTSQLDFQICPCWQPYIFNNVPSREKWIYYVVTLEWVEFSHRKICISGQRARHTSTILLLTKQNARWMNAIATAKKKNQSPYIELLLLCYTFWCPWEFIYTNV